MACATKIPRRDDRQGGTAASQSQHSARTSNTFDRNFVQYAEINLRLDENESRERLEIQRKEAYDRERLIVAIEQSLAATAKIKIKRVFGVTIGSNSIAPSPLTGPSETHLKSITPQLTQGVVPGS